jgi:hypothetical protein
MPYYKRLSSVTKTWRPVGGRGHAMFVWRLDEEAKIEFTITVNWHREDGSIAKTQLGIPEVSAQVREP